MQIFCALSIPHKRGRGNAEGFVWSGDVRLQGEPFPDFYFRGARLMKAFALLAEAMRGPKAQ